MAIEDELSAEVTEILKTRWQAREGRVVPEATDVKLGNDAVKLDGTVLYADLAESTELVKRHSPEFAAEVYKSYLRCASRTIRQFDGVITAFDGDRVMAVYLGDSKNTNAARTALAINHAVQYIINPLIESHYPNKGYKVRQAVGIDTSPLFVARTGIRGSNDLVWVGRAANYAAKLCSLRDDSYPTWITAEVFNRLKTSVRRWSDGRDMWEARTWTAQGTTVYRSNWWVKASTSL
jgi:class 3 adenylate cyclase